MSFAAMQQRPMDVLVDSRHRKPHMCTRMLHHACDFVAQLKWAFLAGCRSVRGWSLSSGRCVLAEPLHTVMKAECNSNANFLHHADAWGRLNAQLTLCTCHRSACQPEGCEDPQGCVPTGEPLSCK